MNVCLSSPLWQQVVLSHFMHLHLPVHTKTYHVPHCFTVTPPVPRCRKTKTACLLTQSFDRLHPAGWRWEAVSCRLTCMCGTTSACWSCPGTLHGPGGSPSSEWTSATTGSIALLTVPIKNTTLMSTNNRNPGLLKGPLWKIHFCTFMSFHFSPKKTKTNTHPFSGSKLKFYGVHKKSRFKNLPLLTSWSPDIPSLPSNPGRALPVT